MQKNTQFMQTAELLKTARKSAKLTQKAIAKRVGLKRSESISEYENGGITPRTDITIRLLEAAGAKVTVTFGDQVVRWETPNCLSTLDEAAIKQRSTIFHRGDNDGLGELIGQEEDNINEVAEDISEDQQEGTVEVTLIHEALQDDDCAVYRVGYEGYAFVANKSGPWMVSVNHNAID